MPGSLSRYCTFFDSCCPPVEAVSSSLPAVAMAATSGWPRLRLPNATGQYRLYQVPVRRRGPWQSLSLPVHTLQDRAVASAHGGINGDEAAQPNNAPKGVTLRQAWERYRDAHLIRKGRSEVTIEGYRDHLGAGG